jgi:hypothetical protein
MDRVNRVVQSKSECTATGGIPESRGAARAPHPQMPADARAELEAGPAAIPPPAVPRWPRVLPGL